MTLLLSFYIFRLLMFVNKYISLNITYYYIQTILFQIYIRYHILKFMLIYFLKASLIAILLK